MTTFGIVVDGKSISQIPSTRRNPQYLGLDRKPATIISQRSCRLFQQDAEGGSSTAPQRDVLLPLRRHDDASGLLSFRRADAPAGSR